MKFTHSIHHRLHAPQEIVVRGMAVPNLESPARAEALLAALQSAGHELVATGEWPRRWISAVHDVGYLQFLETAHARWRAVPNASPVVQAHAFAHHSARTRPRSVQGQVGYYLSGGSCPMVEGTWQAALGSAHAALEAARMVLQGERESYALCRPPGHHAYADFGGGFCYLNNAAIAANHLASELGRVAILDIDTHHGNGTQSIFYRRSDVFFASVHGDPNVLFPYYAGYAEERGEGEGLGCNLNLPLPLQSQDPAWLAAVAEGMGAIRQFDPRALVVSLGFDAFKGDPSSDLAVSTEGFAEAGRLIGEYAGPVLLVQEGGYVVEQLARNLQSFLGGFLHARPPAGR